MVTFLPALCRRGSEDGPAKELSFLCQPGMVHAQHVPREPTEPQICWFLEHTPA